GTFRATDRMRLRFAADVELEESRLGDFAVCTGLDGRARFQVHVNSNNRILHTALVGEMNGVLEAITSGSLVRWGSFGGPRAYSAWVQPAAGIPPRPPHAPGGAAFVARLIGLAPADREEAIAREIIRGNIPDFLRKFHTISVSAGGHSADFEVMPDY